MVNRYMKIMFNPHFWAVTVLFAAGIALQYPQQILGTSSPSLFAFLGLSRATAERVLLLIPVTYTIFVFGKNAGFFSLGLAAVIMLPRVFFISQYLPDALVETIGIVFTGGLINVLHDTDRRERKSHQEMMAKLESVNAELQSRTRTLEEEEKRLATLNQISNTISQSLELDQIRYEAVNSVAEAIPADATWICLENRERTALVPVARFGVIGEFGEIKIAESLCGRVAETGKPLFINDISKDPTLPRASREPVGAALGAGACDRARSGPTPDATIAPDAGASPTPAAPAGGLDHYIRLALEQRPEFTQLKSGARPSARARARPAKCAITSGRPSTAPKYFAATANPTKSPLRTYAPVRPSLTTRKHASSASTSASPHSVSMVPSP